MLTRRNRFHGYGSLKRTYQTGKTVRGSLLSLRYAFRVNKPYRVAVVVSKKVHKSAVIRNRIRRRIYELVRTANTIPPCSDLIFTVHSDRITQMPTAELKSLVNQLLNQVNNPTT